jgi:hypothetical protein
MTRGWGSFVSTEMPSIDEFLNKLRSDYLLGDSWNTRLEELVDWVHKRAQDRAPKGSGDNVGSSGKRGQHGSIRQNIRKQMDGRIFKMWGKVFLPNMTKPYTFTQVYSRKSKYNTVGAGFAVTKTVDFRVAGALEGSKKYHYGPGGPAPGRPTYHWFSASLKHKRALEMLENLVRDIEAKWQR